MKFLIAASIATFAITATSFAKPAPTPKTITCTSVSQTEIDATPAVDNFSAKLEKQEIQRRIDGVWKSFFDFGYNVNLAAESFKTSDGQFSIRVEASQPGNVPDYTADSESITISATNLLTGDGIVFNSSNSAPNDGILRGPADHQELRVQYKSKKNNPEFPNVDALSVLCDLK